MTVGFKKLRPEAIVPAQKHAGDAGWDLATPEAVTLQPGEILTISLGIAAEFPVGYVALFRDRSSLGARGIVVFAGVVDASYRGEWKVVLHNASPEVFTAAAGDRIAQCVFLALPDVTVTEVGEMTPTTRGEGGFGSTGA